MPINSNEAISSLKVISILGKNMSILLSKMGKFFEQCSKALIIIGKKLSIIGWGLLANPRKLHYQTMAPRGSKRKAQKLGKKTKRIRIIIFSFTCGFSKV